MQRVKNILLTAFIIFSAVGVIYIASLPCVDAAGPKITHEQAIEIALKEVGGGYVKEVDLEYKKSYNRLVYEVEVIKNFSDYDVYIDADTGEVLRVKRD